MERAGLSPRKRKTLQWPEEAREIARRHGNPSQKCAELVALSNHDEQACWRYLKRHGVERPAERRRGHYHWPEDALKIASGKGSAVSLCAELKQLTGYSDRTCWAFLKRHGIDRPGAKRRITFTEKLFERLFDCVLNHGQKEASIRFKVSSKTIYNVLYRRGLTSRARDCFTLRDLQMFLRVRPDTILRWVGLGLLKARITTRNDGKPVHQFDSEDVVKFCREHIHALLPRKWPVKRLEFIELIACTPKHADQLATREAKKEQRAYEEQASCAGEDTGPALPGQAQRSHHHQLNGAKRDGNAE